MQFIEALQKRYPVPREESAATTMTVTGIDAPSEAHTKIADRATIRLDARYIANDPNFRSERHLAALIEEIDPNAEITRFQDFSSPLYTSPENPLLQSLKASAEKTEKATFSLVRRHATSDGRFYGDVGDQACEFGIAGEHQHGDQEYVPLKAFQAYKDAIDDFLGKTLVTEAENANTKAYNR